MSDRSITSSSCANIPIYRHVHLRASFENISQGIFEIISLPFSFLNQTSISAIQYFENKKSPKSCVIIPNLSKDRLTRIWKILQLSSTHFFIFTSSSPSRQESLIEQANNRNKMILGLDAPAEKIQTFNTGKPDLPHFEKLSSKLNIASINIKECMQAMIHSAVKMAFHTISLFYSPIHNTAISMFKTIKNRNCSHLKAVPENIKKLSRYNLSWITTNAKVLFGYTLYALNPYFASIVITSAKQSMDTLLPPDL